MFPTSRAASHIADRGPNLGAPVVSDSLLTGGTMRHNSASAFRTPWLRLLGAFLAFGLLAAACGGDDDDDSADSGDDTESGAATPETTADAGEPQPGGKLVIGIDADTG